MLVKYARPLGSGWFRYGVVYRFRLFKRRFDVPLRFTKVAHGTY